MSLDALIDKQDNFELVRDQIASILALEVANQKNLAEASGKNPDLWDFSVFSEASRPWEIDDLPCVNVWYDNSGFSGDTVERQASDTVYNLDCYASAESQNDYGEQGYTSGDVAAALEVQRVVRLVRNIIMAAENTYLQMRGVVWQRGFRSIVQYQPKDVENIIACRMALSVKFNEFSPQVTPAVMELLSVKTYRTGDGKLILTAEFES